LFKREGEGFRAGLGLSLLEMKSCEVVWFESHRSPIMAMPVARTVTGRWRRLSATGGEGGNDEQNWQRGR
jgi:hypothetical protein